MLDLLFSAVSAWKDWIGLDKIALPVLKGLPDGCIVEYVHHNPLSRSMDFVVYHEDWPTVPDGMIPDYWEGGFTQSWEEVDLKLRADSSVQAALASASPNRNAPPPSATVRCDSLDQFASEAAKAIAPLAHERAQQYRQSLALAAGCPSCLQEALQAANKAAGFPEPIRVDASEHHGNRREML